ncbi:MAG TPA: S1/P1 nuclease [Rhodocyclaceae bacterium]|nr:S1/P1 nuclease [Rhodocyclaceae bacterium]
MCRAPHFYLLLLLLFCGTMPARAWNAAGHRIVAAIAWQELTPAARLQIAMVLVAHPEYARWVKPGTDGQEQAAFIEAGCWPDDIRRDPRFYDEESESPTPPLPGLADTRRHRRWHYLDLPLEGGGNTGVGELDRQLPRLLAALSPQRSFAERAYALPWVIHLLADVHQPLHVASKGDEGGNRTAINDPFSSRLPESNLHRWWDDLPGPPWLRDAYLERTVARLLREYPDPVTTGSVALWLEESRNITRLYGYPPTVDDPATITEEFRQQAERVTRQRLVAAGRRLAAILERIFSVSRETP